MVNEAAKEGFLNHKRVFYGQEKKATLINPHSLPQQLFDSLLGMVSYTNQLWDVLCMLNIAAHFMNLFKLR